MEAMHICLATVRDLSYLIITYSPYSLVAGFAAFIFLLRFYCWLTLGICDCKESMEGKTVVITGASSGIGKATAFDLAKRGARVLLACRNRDKTEKVAEEIRSQTKNPNVIVKDLDLCSFRSVRKCAEDILKTEERLDVLINNAGVTGRPPELTEDGCEKVMQSNYLGHFLFTLLLIDLLKKSAPSRIINVSSLAHAFAKLDVEDLKNEKRLSDMNVYANSKLANILFSQELASKLHGTGVTVNSLHPGAVKTNILTGPTTFLILISKILFIIVGKSCEEGAQTTIHLAVDPRLEKVTGKYFSDCKEIKPSAKALDKKLAKHLFEITEKIVGISFPKF
ncbi:Retinol dehydrogenase 12, partial [Stegodyphus mimosarum]